MDILTINSAHTSTTTITYYILLTNHLKKLNFSYTIEVN